MTSLWLIPIPFIMRRGMEGGASGHGIIITQHAKLFRYVSMLTRQVPIESQFLKKLVDNLNAEIALGPFSSSFLIANLSFAAGSGLDGLRGLRALHEKGGGDCEMEEGVSSCISRVSRFP